MPGGYGAFAVCQASVKSLGASGRRGPDPSACYSVLVARGTKAHGIVGISSGIVMSTLIGCGAAGSAPEAVAEGPRETPENAETADGDPSIGAEAHVASPEVRLLGTHEAQVRVRVQVAREEFDRERGLMFRRHLDADAGMLFVFEQMEPLSFWMENTFIPLDVLFIDGGGRIVGIVTDTVPLTQDLIEVDAPSQYVLEVNAGFVRRHGIEAGSQVELIGVSLPAGAP